MKSFSFFVRLAFCTILMLLVAVPALAVGDAYFPQDTTLQLDGTNYTISQSSHADQITASGDTLTLLMSAGQEFTIRSTDKKIMTNSGDYSYSCSSSESRLTITIPSGLSQQTITVTPKGDCTTANSSGSGTGSSGGTSGGGGGGGGGAGSSTTTTSSPVPVATSTPISSQAPSQISTPPLFIVQPAGALSVKPGATGLLVYQIQARLSTLGFLPPKTAGPYGPATTAAVKKFQSSKKLPVTGIVDPSTATALGIQLPSPLPKKVTTRTSTITLSNKTLKVGSVGTEVLQLQEYLTANGYLSVDSKTGYFGTKTLAAVKKLQAKLKIQPMSGIFGPLTQAAIGGLMSR